VSSNLETEDTVDHLATPPGTGPWPGVVVLHEAFGLNDDIRAYADRFAAEGYLALAPDLFGGKPGIRCVMRGFRELDAGHGPTFDAIDNARGDLARRPECTGRVGVIGFCLTGGFALLAAVKHDFAVAAVNYGKVPDNAATVLRGACPVVASYGGRDAANLRHAASALDSALTQAGVPHDVKEYPDAGHGFLNRHRPAAPLKAILKLLGNNGFRPEDASDAWSRITAFFAEHLDTAPQRTP
jgi:carboxymethylenebutenolidase